MTIQCAASGGNRVLVTWDGYRWTATDLETGKTLCGFADSPVELEDDLSRAGLEPANH